MANQSLSSTLKPNILLIKILKILANAPRMLCAVWLK